MGTSLLERIWRSVAEQGRALARLPNSIDAEASAVALAHALLSQNGEATGAARAVALVDAYLALDNEQRHRFHAYLAQEFQPEPERLKTAALAYHAAPSPGMAAALNAASESPRQELLRRMNVA